MVGTWVEEFYMWDDRVSSLKVQNFPLKSSYWYPGCQWEKEGCSPLPAGQQILQLCLSLLRPTQQTLIALLHGCSLLDGGVSVGYFPSAGWQGSHRAGLHPYTILRSKMLDGLFRVSCFSSKTGCVSPDYKLWDPRFLIMMMWARVQCLPFCKHPDQGEQNLFKDHWRQ